LFITLEGGEGTGKSTQARRLAARFNAAGRTAQVTREPGGSPMAERIRSLILAPGEGRFDAVTETLLFYAARNAHLEGLIRPALARNEIVICDRFSDSTRIYQGVMGTVSEKLLVSLDELIVGATQPDLTLVLDLPAKIGMERAAIRRGAIKADGFEAESLSFHERLREAFVALAKSHPDRCVLIDAQASEQDVDARIFQVVKDRLGHALAGGENGH
jgi:dTMP kinase